MYIEKAAEIVDRFGGFREREILRKPHTIEIAETWNSEHQVLNVCELSPGPDGYKGGFQVDLITMSICG